MEGVKILNEIGPMIGIYSFMLVLVSIMLIYSIVSAIRETHKNRIKWIIYTILCFLILCITIFGIFFSPSRYEVIVDDNVKLSEFEEKYEIIERRGNIYVVEERENGK